MLGPQTQHKGTVYGDDENAPKPGLGLFFFFFFFFFTQAVTLT